MLSCSVQSCADKSIGVRSSDKVDICNTDGYVSDVTPPPRGSVSDLRCPETAARINKNDSFIRIITVITITIIIW